MGNERQGKQSNTKKTKKNNDFILENMHNMIGQSWL